MQSTTQQKQRFLREQILQSSYDPEEFVSFLCKDLGIQELDAELIDMRTLQSVVMKFKQYKYYKDQPKGKKVKIEYVNVFVMQEKGGVYDYEYQGKWKCVQGERLMQDLQVFVPQFEVRQTQGLFFSIGSRTEIWFIVQSNASKMPVKRLQEDFQWLSDMIGKLHPLLAIPELIENTKDSEGNHQKRRKELEEYLQILAKRKELWISNLFYDFLTVPAEKMEKVKKGWDSVGFAKGMQSIKNQEGSVKLAFTNKLRTLVQNTTQFNRTAQVIHQSISACIDRVSGHFASASLQITKIVEYFAQLHQAYNQLINRSPQQKVNQYNQILININNMFHLLSQNMSASSKIFTTHLKEFHKVQLNYDRSVTKLSRMVAEAEKEYVYFKTNLNRKKERIYPDVTRWQVQDKMLENRRISKEEAFDMMLPRETQQQEDMRNWMAYLYCNYKDEFHNYTAFQVNRYVQVFCTLCSDLLLSNRTYVEELTKFIEDSRKITIK